MLWVRGGLLALRAEGFGCWSFWLLRLAWDHSAGHLDIRKPIRCSRNPCCLCPVRCSLDSSVFVGCSVLVVLMSRMMKRLMLTTWCASLPRGVMITHTWCRIAGVRMPAGRRVRVESIAYAAADLAWLPPLPPCSHQLMEVPLQLPLALPRLRRSTTRSATVKWFTQLGFHISSPRP